MSKLTNEYIQERIAGNEKVREAYIDENGDAVIVAAEGFGWDCGDMSPALVDLVPPGRGVKYFHLSLDLIRPIAAIKAAPVEKLTEAEQAEYQADCEGDAKHEARIYEDVADDE